MNANSYILVCVFFTSFPKQSLYWDFSLSLLCGGVTRKELHSIHDKYDKRVLWTESHKNKLGVLADLWVDLHGIRSAQDDLCLVMAIDRAFYWAFPDLSKRRSARNVRKERPITLKLTCYRFQCNVVFVFATRTNAKIFAPLIFFLCS